MKCRPETLLLRTQIFQGAILRHAIMSLTATFRRFAFTGQAVLSMIMNAFSICLAIASQAQPKEALQQHLTTRFAKATQ
jgi:hypothetical protein